MLPGPSNVPAQASRARRSGGGLEACSRTTRASALAAAAPSRGMAGRAARGVGGAGKHMYPLLFRVFGLSALGC